VAHRHVIRRAARLCAAALACAVVAAPAAAQRPAPRTPPPDSSSASTSAPSPNLEERGDTLVVALAPESVARFVQAGAPRSLVDTLRVLFAPDTVFLLHRDAPRAPLRPAPATPLEAHAFRLARDAARAARKADALFEALGLPAGTP
jgi:hypothetical protein